MKSFYKNLLLWLAIGIIIVFVFDLVKSDKSDKLDEVPFSEFMEKVDRQEIREVTIDAGEQLIHSMNSQGKEFKAYIIMDSIDSTLLGDLREKGVRVKMKPEDKNPWYDYVLTWLPMLIFIGIWIFFMRQMQIGGNKTLSFGKNPAKLLTEDHRKTTFKDVGGLKEAKQQLDILLNFLKDPQRYQKLGVRVPKGILLTGPPGSGKTMLARALAGEADVPFLCVNASEFVEMFVGVGAARIKDLFEQAKKNAPCIVFIDEIDSIGGRRALSTSGAHEERDQTLNQLLFELDGFNKDNEGIVVLGATNRPQILDAALTRPGRLEWQIALEIPDDDTRHEILQIHTRNKPLSDDVDLAIIAKSTFGFSGSELEGLCNNAALLAAEEKSIAIASYHFEEAKSQMFISLHNPLHPQSIHSHLDQHVIGQEQAKKVLSVAVSNHYTRIEAIKKCMAQPVHIKKSNVLLLGPTGSGKTLLVESIAHYLRVPFTIVNATTLTKTGYVGADAENILYKLLLEADFNIRKAEYGIICIDEFDKLKRNDQGYSPTLDISGASVQQDLLKIIEGATIDVPKEGGRFAGNVEYYQLNTQNILFICVGAFVDLDKIINSRFNSSVSGEHLLQHVQAEDIINYGFIPELVGRLPIITFTKELSASDLTRILYEPQYSLVNQYTELLKLQGCNVEFTQEALEQIAHEAIRKGVGARGLRSILETVLLNIMYCRNGDESKHVITGKLVMEQLSQNSENQTQPAYWLQKKERHWNKTAANG